jgi:hypothetical protein
MGTSTYQELHYNISTMATNKWHVILPQGTISKEQAKTYRGRGGVAKTIRATRSDKGKKRK